MNDKEEISQIDPQTEEDMKQIKMMLDSLSIECRNRGLVFIGAVAMKESAMATMQLPSWFAVQVVEGQLKCVDQGPNGSEVDPESTVNVGSGILKMLGGIAQGMGVALNNVVNIHKVIVKPTTAPRTAPGKAPNIILPAGSGKGNRKKNRKH